MGLIQPATLHMWQGYSWQALNSLPHSGHNLLIQQIKPANIFQAFFIKSLDSQQDSLHLRQIIHVDQYLQR